MCKSMYCCTVCLGCTDCSGMCACWPALCCWRWIVWCMHVSCIDSDVRSCFELWSAFNQSSWIRRYIRVMYYYYYKSECPSLSNFWPVETLKLILPSAVQNTQLCLTFNQNGPVGLTFRHSNLPVKVLWFSELRLLHSILLDLQTLKSS